MARNLAATGRRMAFALAARHVRPAVAPAYRRCVASSPIASSSRSFATIRPSPVVPALVPQMSYQPTEGKASPIVHSFFDKPTATWTYVVVDPETREALVIDPVLDFDPASGRIGYGSVHGLAAFVQANNYTVVRLVETHVHADHLTGAHALKTILPEQPPILVGDQVHQAQNTFATVYGYDVTQFEGSFDELMADGGESTLGTLPVRYMALPGHTPESMGVLVGDAIFAGDSLFMPDVGTARVDFPGGSAKSLYASIQRVFALDPAVRVFCGHDYPPNREIMCMADVAEHTTSNKHVGGGASEAVFVKQREDRDATLGAPRLLHASLQVNLRGGRLPPADSEGRYFLKTPLRLPQ